VTGIVERSIMSGEIILESSKPIKFEGYCVHCGKKTRQKLAFDTDGTTAALMILGLPLSFLLNDPWVPFCLGCKWNAFKPDSKCTYNVITAIALVSLAFFCFVTEKPIFGAIAFICSMVQLYFASKNNRAHKATTYPVWIERRDGKFIYVFTAGHYYERLHEEMDSENVPEKNCGCGN